MKNQLQLKRNSDSVIVYNDLFFCELTRKTAGMPAAIGFEQQGQPVIQTQIPLITAMHDKAGLIKPVLETFKPHLFQNKQYVRILFPDISWQNETCRKIEGYRLSLDYQFNPDGAVFVNTFFYCETLNPGKISKFCLNPVIMFETNQRVNWAYWKFPPKVQADIIQNMTHVKRNLYPRGENLFSKQIVPFFSFDFGSNNRRNRHVEFFIESFNSLSSDCNNTETSLSWKKNKVSISWNFQKTPKILNLRTYQWSNTWGWCLRKPPEKRKMPFRIFHYLDNFQHYPVKETIQKVAQEGANLLILHENWRLDYKGQQVPYDIDRLKKTINCCHKNKLRTAIYVRATEDGIRREFAERLRPFLKKNYDGLYIDFSSPITYMQIEEYAPGGRIPFQEYYNMTKRLRAFIGKDGVLISHSGACFSAIGHTVIDAILTGEQEHGLIFKNRKNHAYLCGISVACPNLWTAAFPHYRSKKVIPFLASTLQSPFLHIGQQIPSSPLAHPSAPQQVNFVRHLWRIWSIFDRFKYIRFYSDSTNEEIIRTDSSLTGASTIVNKNGDILLTAANFSNRPRQICVEMDYRKMGTRKPEILYNLYADKQKTDFKLMPNRGKFRATVEGNGIHSWLLTHNKKYFLKPLNNFALPCGLDKKELNDHKMKCEEKRKVRFMPPSWPKCYLRVAIENWPNNYEDSLWWDLFENQIELVEKTQNKLLGYITTKGLTKKPSDRQSIIWPGLKSAWMPLHKILKFDTLPKGCVKLSLITKKGNSAFYSFIQVCLSPLPRECSQSYTLTYDNDIDRDWSRLDFNIHPFASPQKIPI